MRDRPIGADGTPDLAQAVPGMPNTSLDLEAFTATAYAAFKRALTDEPGLMAAIERLFPQMGLREKLTLRWLAIPRGKDAIAKLQASIDRPLPFPNGVPGSTNGVAALKHQLHVTARDRFHDGAGFVSVPVLADRFWRSALLADGAYVAKNRTRFRAIAGEEARTRDPREFAAIASFFMVPSMGMSDVRVAGRDPASLTEVMRWLRDFTAAALSRPDRSFARGGGPRRLCARLRDLPWQLRRQPRPPAAANLSELGGRCRDGSRARRGIHAGAHRRRAGDAAWPQLSRRGIDRARPRRRCCPACGRARPIS